MRPEIKDEVANPPGPDPQRGWTGVGLESTSKLSRSEGSRLQSDAKVNSVYQTIWIQSLIVCGQEHFDQGHNSDAEYPNRWPNDNDLLGFRDFMERCYEICDCTCMQLMRALEMGLELETGSLTERCVPSASDLRLNHYPAICTLDLRGGSVGRISPHTDFGVISLLLQDGVGGLEIEDRTHPNSFLPVEPRQMEMIVNVSDTLQRWTNDELRAGVHRVTMPHDMNGDGDAVLPERFSMAFFFKAGRRESVAPLAKFAGLQQPPKYHDMTALEFQKWRNGKMYVN